MPSEQRCWNCGSRFLPYHDSDCFCCKGCRIRYKKLHNVTKSEYCIDCQYSYQNLNTFRWICRKTGKIVVSTDGRGTVNAMKCY